MAVPRPKMWDAGQVVRVVCLLRSGAAAGTCQQSYVTAASDAGFRLFIVMESLASDRPIRRSHPRRRVLLPAASMANALKTRVTGMSAFGLA